ncbi:putative rhamnosyl transferase [Corynebacterium sp. BF-R-2]|uniref:putative rhamnosyl transferase n=1 Tax=Corynebacterium sp. BF-R-2 TaxID=2943494 RepID=UPI00211E53A0|nr:putative rhamnosyl transferase [Corynebacterium sp. BF-R-2]MCQ9677723.1 putative rhamnosyl transferase [Corynebacterium sp. BF-R-2]
MFVGHTRFSLFVPDSASWRASNEQTGFSVDEYHDYLYDDARLSLRTDIFLNHTVPTLVKAAKGFEVKHIVSFSESLPQKFKEQLQKAADRIDILHLDELPDGDSGWTAVRRYVQETGFEGTFGRYRLDDDDVLSAHYFRTTAPYIKPEFEGMLVSLPLGIEAVYVDGQFFHLRETHTPMNSMGLMSVCSVKEDGTVVEPQSGPHDKSDRYAPVILDASQMGYLRAIHAGQDNAMRHEPGVVMARLMENMAAFPPFANAAALEAAFPTVAEQMKSTSTTLNIDSTVGSGQHYFLQPASADVSFAIHGESECELDNELLVSLWIEDSRGRRVPSYKLIEGFAASNNPSIGHFTYVPTESGTFRTLVSLHLEHGYILRGFRILAQSERAERVQVLEIVMQQRGGKARFVSTEEWESSRSQGVRSLVDQAIDSVYQNRTSIVANVRSVLGEDRSNKVIARLDQLNKKIRK